MTLPNFLFFVVLSMFFNLLIHSPPINLGRLFVHFYSCIHYVLWVSNSPRPLSWVLWSWLFSYSDYDCHFFGFDVVLKFVVIHVFLSCPSMYPFRTRFLCRKLLLHHWGPPIWQYMMDCYIEGPILHNISVCFKQNWLVS